WFYIHAVYTIRTDKVGNSMKCINSRCLKNIVIALCLSLGSAGAFAEESHSQGTQGSEGDHGKHVLAVFLGVTHEHSENLETLGIEYSYRINKSWSVGGVIERAEREKDSTLAILFAHLWPYKGLFLGAGVGRKDPGDERENVLRGTIGYEFELGKGWSIAPQANLDVIENEDNEEVYGIAFGKRF
ncbi:porin family protein, partial [Desulfosarcina sp.]|nr:porin family protein [Desulfosarcina sp.]